MLIDRRSCGFALCLVATIFLPSAISAQDSQSDRRTIETKLDGKISLLYIDQPLSRVLTEIAKRHAISIKVDERVKKARPDGSVDRVNIELADVSLRSCMSMLLRNYDLEYVNEGNRLLVTTSEHAKTVHQEDRYLLPQSVAKDAEELVQLIRELILGATGTVKVEGNELVVTAPRAERATIGKLVEQFQPNIDAGKTPAELEIAQILKEPANMNYILTPLAEAIHTISKAHGVRIVIDRKTMEQAGITADTPVTFELQGIDLGRSLRFMLNSCNLSYIVKDECVLVTTKEVVDAHREIAVYKFPTTEQQMHRIYQIFDRFGFSARLTPSNRIVPFKHYFVVYGDRPAHKATENFVDFVTQRMHKEQARKVLQAKPLKEAKGSADPFAG